MLDKKLLAGFIITYERPEVLFQTISLLFSQSLPPEKLWIIDNSSTDLTQNLVVSLNKEKLIYHRTGCNLGPAGAAKIGLSLVYAAGYEWIFWGDDDDPPPNQDTIEKLMEIPLLMKSNKTLGQVGMVGQYFNPFKGIITRVTDKELEENEILEIDTIAGNQCKIVNRKVIEKGVFPTGKLFFGFEELDFDIQLKKMGFTSFVRTDLFKLQRNMPSRDAHIRSKLFELDTLWRQYYSLRNVLYIFQKNRMITALMLTLVRKNLKVIYSFRYGLDYGVIMGRYTFLAILHWMVGKYGFKKFNN